MCFYKAYPKNSGFTMVELMAVIVLMTIMFSVGIVAFNSSSTSVAAESASAEVMTVLQQARQYAINNARPVYVVFPHNRATSDGEPSRYLRGYNVYSEGEGFVSEWRLLPEGVIFSPVRAPYSGSAFDNVLEEGILATYKYTINFPDVDSPQEEVRAIKFLPSGSAKAEKSEAEVSIVHGVTSAEAGSYTSTNLNAKVVYTVAVKTQSGAIRTKMGTN